ncbi:hypothetical protein [uncultured Roseobacter sp.]|uniref:hypothetical protein n=1 Tax=uncultured Roseobacter sp. TaxID=114847 RepID=UPI0026341039|nr:hypothetical protein [uncultured Roseobacter sp.]
MKRGASMQPHSDLATALGDWDGASASALAEIYCNHSGEPEFLLSLLEACRSPETEGAATWLIKHHCEQSEAPLPPQMVATLYALLPGFTDWAAQLHILQCVDHLSIPPEAADTVMDFLTRAATSERKLVCAWSLYAAAQLAVQHPDHRPAARALLDTASARGHSGAVAVRLRKARTLLERA